jgi:hypothetical protein
MATKYIVWGDGETKALDGFTTEDAHPSEISVIPDRGWLAAADVEGSEAWAVIVQAAVADLHAVTAFDPNVWGFQQVEG